MNEEYSGACIRYAPGEIVSLRFKPAVGDAPTDAASISRSRDASLLQSDEFFRGRLVLELHGVVPGAEMWQLAAMQQAEPQATFSLNYLGSAADWPQWLFGRGRKPSEPTPSGKLHCYSDGGNVEMGWPKDPPTACVLVVDISKEHCAEVMLAAAGGARSAKSGRGSFAILGIYLPDSRRSLASVHEYLLALLTGVAQAPAPVVAVNMSVDFGQACNQSDANVNGASTVALSFPIFERALNEAREAASSSGCVPAIFAAAGNKLREGSRGWRLAYPAVRADVIAVTSAEQRARGMALSEDVDFPAAHEFKPCFAAPLEEVRMSGVEKPGTTSMASGWAAGLYGALVAADENESLRAAPPLAKVAQLQSCSEWQSLEGGDAFWGMPGVYRMPHSRAALKRGSLEDRLRMLNQTFPNNEFVVTGSLAAVARLLTKFPGQGWEALRDVSSLFGDVDLVAAAPLPSSDFDRCRELVREWLGSWSLFDHAIDLASRDASVAFPTLSQAIIPASQLAVTQDGFVDGHGGLGDIDNWHVRLRLPPESVWNTNPAYRAGIAGAALGILIWLNTRLLL